MTEETMEEQRQGRTNFWSKTTGVDEENDRLTTEERGVARDARRKDKETCRGNFVKVTGNDDGFKKNIVVMVASTYNIANVSNSTTVPHNRFRFDVIESVFFSSVLFYYSNIYKFCLDGVFLVSNYKRRK